jgi:hypothetical protein
MTVNVQDLGSGTKRFVFYSNSLQLLKKGDFLTFHLKASSTLPLGNYTISIDEIVYSDLEGTITKEGKVNATATVTGTESIIVTVKNIAREYADANPSFEYTVEGGELVGVPEITCEATEASSVGTYDIVVAKGSVSNPNVTYINGTLAITKAPLTIKAGTYTRKQDKKNPEFTLEYVGFKRNETEAVLTKKPVVSTNAKKGSPVGEYDVIVSGAEAQNYEISYVNGKLIITEASDSSYIPGDVNGDGVVNVTDIVATVNFIMEKPSDGFNEDAADLNDDGVVNVTDIVKMVSIIMNGNG